MAVLLQSQRDMKASRCRNQEKQDKSSKRANNVPVRALAARKKAKAAKIMEKMMKKAAAMRKVKTVTMNRHIRLSLKKERTQSFTMTYTAPLARAHRFRSRSSTQETTETRPLNPCPIEGGKTRAQSSNPYPPSHLITAILRNFWPSLRA